MKKTELSTYIPVDTEDLDDSPVNVADIPTFVRVYFGDNSDGSYIPNERETDNFGLSAYRKYDDETGTGHIMLEPI